MKQRRFLITILIISLLAAYGFVPKMGQAVSFESLKDTISDSDRSAVATHVFIASTTQTITAGGYIEIQFPASFTGVSSSNVTCPTGGVAGGSGQNMRCTFASQLAATSTQITITTVTNPGTVGSYLFYVYTKDSLDAEIEKGTLRVAIVNDVTVTATVEASLTFSITGLATTTPVNNGYTTGSSTSQTLDFGVVSATTTPEVLGQRLLVTTNAMSGFTVTVFQDHNLSASNGADIDSFDDGVPGAAAAWSAPAGTLGAEATYGHFGLTSNDNALSAGDEFGNWLFKGFNGTAAMEVMYHTGPADGQTDNIGSTTVAYAIQISALQEAGDYSNTLTYICTPTY